MSTIRKDLSFPEIRRFGWVSLGGFLALGLLCWYRGRMGGRWGWSGTGWQEVSLLLGFAGVVFAGICQLSHVAGLRLYVGWMTLGLALGRVMSVVFLSLLFVFLLPVFALIRLGDPLRLRRSGASTYWEDHRPHEPTLERTLRPF